MGICRFGGSICTTFVKERADDSDGQFMTKISSLASQLNKENALELRRIIKDEYCAWIDNRSTDTVQTVLYELKIKLKMSNLGKEDQKKLKKHIRKKYYTDKMFMDLIGFVDGHLRGFNYLESFNKTHRELC